MSSICLVLFLLGAAAASVGYPHHNSNHHFQRPSYPHHGGFNSGSSYGAHQAGNRGGYHGHPSVGYGDQNRYHDGPHGHNSGHGHNPYGGYNENHHVISCVGKSDGTLIGDINTNCRNFFWCQGNYGVLLSCPRGKRFDAHLGACTYSKKAVCTYKPVRPPIVTTVVPTVIPTAGSTTTAATTTITTIIPTL